MRPLVVTLAVEDDVQARWDELRRAWFPPERLLVGAHVTLFHAVPGTLEAMVREDVAEVAGTPYAVRVSGVRSLGRGAALEVVSPELDTVHRELQRRWSRHLTAQDRQRLKPHVTIQNKVEPAVARATVAELGADFTAYDVATVGYDLWRYDGGPWTHLARVSFRAGG